MELDKKIDDIFNLLSRVRTNPGEFVTKYSELAQQYEGKIFRGRVKTREGVNALNDLIGDLKARSGGFQSPQPLKWCFGLHMIADAQAKRLGENGLLTTEGSSLHQSLPDRAKEYTIVKGRISEVY